MYNACNAFNFYLRYIIQNIVRKTCKKNWTCSKMDLDSVMINASDRRKARLSAYLCMVCARRVCVTIQMGRSMLSKNLHMMVSKILRSRVSYTFVAFARTRTTRLETKECSTFYKYAWCSSVTLSGRSCSIFASLHFCYGLSRRPASCNTRISLLGFHSSLAIMTQHLFHLFENNLSMKKIQCFLVRSKYRVSTDDYRFE